MAGSGGEQTATKSAEYPQQFCKEGEKTNQVG